jgi:poly-gamma-glutamate capsule biosynthesis protein CapA/YwtB (metallophosphatase superfamily)
LAIAPAAAAQSSHRHSTPPRTVTITAIGDLILGNTPSVPAHPRDYLRGIRQPLTHNSDIVFGNLEGVLTNRSSPHKCSTSTSSDCFTFRNPTSFASTFADVGFTVLNSANNHSHDYYSAGAQDTSNALRSAGVKQAGTRTSVARVHVHGLWVALLGFAPYSYDPNLLDVSTAAKVIHHAASNNDIVVVYMHAGAEGSSATHVTGREEYAFGEDRGNPKAFAHMAIDNGAKLVIASGPHVLRGMEFYRGHLIAYSLGNSANFHNFGRSGDLAKSAVLRVTLGRRGGFQAGRLISVQLVDPGRPVLGGDSVAFVRELGKEDFGSVAARLSQSGIIRAPD